ncbi:MAG: 30S ribosomal protein S12 methylthiotransferase RimO [Christensenellales bacterium]
MAKIGIVSLGCSKNRVDSELISGKLLEAGHEIVMAEQDADVIIVNTCGFIGPAKEEAIDTILEMAQYKKTGSLKKLVVAGCLAQRYSQDIYREMPEVDVVVGMGQYGEIATLLEQDGRSLLAGPGKGLSGYGKRPLTTPPYTAYIRVADGCDNRCSYCAIPLIRGPFRSRGMESILSEVETLAKRGVREFNFIAQDTTRYGMDLYGRKMLAPLLEQASEIDGVHWIRLLYLYPEMIDEALLDVVAGRENILNYIEMPIQHASASVLRRMNRRGHPEMIRRLMGDLRTLGDFIIRTSLITGFPGESKQEFEELVRFIQENEFDRLGVFVYSREEDTPAYEMPQVAKAVAVSRRDRLMRLQQGISACRAKARVGQTCEVLVEGTKDGIYFGRSFGEAPEIDPLVYFSGPAGKRPGDFVQVLLTDSGEYDLMGELLI